MKNKNIKTFLSIFVLVFSAMVFLLTSNAFAGSRGVASSVHPSGWYGWHNVNGVKKYYPNLSITPKYTMGALAVPGKIYHAIYVIDANSKVRMNKIIGNISNVLDDPRLKGHIKIELIAFGTGTHIYFKGNGLEKKLLKLKKEGVELAQCANTLDELHIPVSKLYPFIKIVPSAQGEVILRESEGYAFLKP